MSDESQTGRTRRGFLTATGVTAAAALAGCSGQTDSTATEGDDGDEMSSATETSGGDDSAATSTDGTLSLSIPEASNFDPVQIKGDGSQRVSDQVFSELMALPRGEDPQGLTPEAQLATDYELSDDGRTYTFTLREDVTFHDGTGLTAQDFVYSWERLAASDNSQESPVILEGGFRIAHETTTETVDGEDQEVYDPGTLQVEAVDDYTLEVTLESPFFDALFWFAYGSLSPIPEGIVGDIAGYDGEMDYAEFSSQAPVGTGPYRVDDIRTGTQVSLAAVDDYHGEPPGPDRIQLQVVQNADTRYRRAAERNVDIFQLPNSRFDPTKVSIDETRSLGQEVGTYGPLSNGETVNYSTWDEAYTAYFIFDCSRVERPIRRALNYAVNQENFVEQGFKGVGEPAYHQSPPSVYPGGKEAYDRHAEENFPYGYREARVDEARSVMEEAGYTADSPAELTLTVYNDRNPDAYARIADLIRTKASAINLELTVETAPFGTIIDEAISGNLDMYTLGNGLEYPSPTDMLKFGRPYEGNLVRWREDPSDASERAASAWETIQSNLGPSEAAEEARADAFLEMEEAIWEDAIYLTNYHPRGQQFWYDDVDVPVHPTGFHDRLYDDVSL
ncbi:ABC transporter substrate-binding protein [Halobaculum sp. MBLA0143]|uniref:ABC transporter substrate-binding protein n=1 Tax=Halobaculum sp. MBLA0143 TaxID=3079933 RepID=UPI00352556B5